MHTISLTFDNGPEPGVTDFVLDTLASRDVRAAFFVVGSKLVIAERFTVVLWNVVPRDWERPHAWVDIALEACRRIDHAVPETAQHVLGRDHVEATVLQVDDHPANQRPVVLGQLDHPAGDQRSDQGHADRRRRRDSVSVQPIPVVRRPDSSRG